MTKLKHSQFAAFFLAAILLISLLLSIGGGHYAAADTNVLSTYESQNVLEDLKGMTIDGETLDLSEYYFDNNKTVKVLSFVEFGYSFNTANQNDYGLYVYVYNPCGLDFTQNPGLNKLQFRYGNNENYEKYPLNYLNRSNATGYEGLFYKFKVVLTQTQRTDILNGLDSSSRVYDVSGIELCGAGDFNATEYDVSNVYTYTGYAAGYGSEFDTESTLACTNSGSVTLSLDVHGAAYRPEGTNGTNNYTQDMLHSVYFSIPNSYINEYGEMTAVHATWLNAKTAPIFVTGNDDVYNALYFCVWENDGVAANLDYCWAARANYGPEPDEWHGDLYYGDTPKIWNLGTGDPDKSKYVNNLYYLFKAPNGIADINNADHYTLKGSEVLDYIRTYTETVGGSSELVAGKYNGNLFESWDTEPTEMNITNADYKIEPITSQKISLEWWQKLFGISATHGTHLESSTTFNDIEAIHAVSNADFGRTQSETCLNLYIDESYYKDFKDYYDEANANDKTVYLLRYYQSAYECREVTEFSYKSSWGVAKSILNKLDTNAYVAQEVVSLDFDIIDVTLTKDGISTVIACVSSPIDIVPDVTPPVNTTSDPTPLWRKILVILGIAFILFVVFRVFQWLAGGGKKG